MLTVCTYAFGFIFTFINVILNIFFYAFRFINNSSQPNLLLFEIQNSFNGSLIQSLSLKPSCDGDETKVILGVWDGTKEGCECNGIIYQQSCSDKQIENNCILLYENPPLNYTVFNSSFLCAKRMKIKYKELLKTNKIISSEETCPQNYKLCGVLDTLDRLLCVKDDETCPINTDTLRFQIFNLFNRNETLSTSYHYLNYNLDSNNKTIPHLISSIKIIQFKPCINPNEKFWDYHYILEPEEQRCQTEIKGNSYDNRYIKLTDLPISKLELYNENLITEKLKDIKDISLNRIKNDPINLFSKNFLGFDIKDLENSDFNCDEIIDKMEEINNCFFAEFIYSTIAFGSLILFLIFCLIKGIECEKGAIKLELDIENIKGCFYYLFGISTCASPLIYLIIFSIIFNNLRSIESMLRFEIVDKNISELIENLIDQSSFNYKFSLAMVIISTINITLFIVALCSFIYDKINEALNPKKISLINKKNNDINA